MSRSRRRLLRIVGSALVGMAAAAGGRSTTRVTAMEVLRWRWQFHRLLGRQAVALPIGAG